jgi:TonB family protein
MKPLVRLHFGEGESLLLLLAVCLAAAIVSLQGLRSTHAVKTADDAARRRVRLLSAGGDPATAGRGQSVVADLFDPSAMSLPSPHGFSRRLWQHGAPVKYQSADWGAVPAFLERVAASAMRPLLEQPPLVDTVQSMVEKGTAGIGDTAVEPVAVVPSENRTLFLVSGALAPNGRSGLAGRAVVRTPSLPVVTNETALKPTRVRIGVAPDGTVRFASVERSCGKETVDAQAVELAQQIRFEPATDSKASSLDWGVVKILWATELPPVTNGDGEKRS